MANDDIEGAGSGDGVVRAEIAEVRATRNVQDLRAGRGGPARQTSGRAGRSSLVTVCTWAACR